MKEKAAARLMLSGLCIALTALPALADDATVDTKTITTMPAPELPPSAAKLVKDAPAEQLEQTVREVVKVTVKVNPSATVPVVSSIVSARPECGYIAAGTAAVLAPKQAVLIARAAAVAVPAQVGRIVQVVCEAVPKQYKEVTLAVASVAPGHNQEILDGLVMAFPNLKNKLTKAYNGSVSTNSMETILQQIDKPTTVASDMPIDPVEVTPVVGPAIVPPLTAPIADPGGRNYSHP